MSDSLDPLVERVADNTLERDMEGHDWQKSAVINALLESERPEYVEEARKIVDRSIETQTSAGQFSYGSLDYRPWFERLDQDVFKGIADPAAVGRGVVEFYNRTGEDYYLDAATHQWEFLQDATRTEEGGISHIRDEAELWVDSLYMLCPFLAKYGLAAKEPEAVEDAIRQFRLQSKYLQDDHRGLFRHEWREQPNMYPESTFWSRGNGWAAMALVDTLEILPDDHHARSELVEIFCDLVETVVTLQDDTGYWHHILDDDRSPLETSGTLQFAYSFKKGIEAGVLDFDPYHDAAKRAMQICEGCVDTDGNVNRVAVPPGGPDVPFGDALVGQGIYLLAAQQF